jgi:replication factor C subunit 2/4
MLDVSFTTDNKKRKPKLSTRKIDKLPWVEKHRPTNIDDVIVSDIIRTKIDKIIEDKNMPNIIITGEPGTGKTSTIKCIAKKFIPPDKYERSVLELNASDERGLNMINNTIIHFCQKKISGIPHKIVILDEADSITSKAQNLLTNILDTYIDTTRFAFICNDITKITESIQSKCMLMNYPKMESNWIRERLLYIINEENIIYDNEGLEALIFCSNGDIRQAINYLECLFYSFKKINKHNVYLLCHTPKPTLLNKMFHYMVNQQFKETIHIVKELSTLGYTPNDIVVTMINMLIEDYDVDLDTKYKIIYLEELNKTNIRFNNGAESLLQLVGCIAIICNKIGNGE